MPRSGRLSRLGVVGGLALLAGLGGCGSGGPASGGMGGAGGMGGTGGSGGGAGGAGSGAGGGGGFAGASGVGGGGGFAGASGVGGGAGASGVGGAPSGTAGGPGGGGGLPTGAAGSAGAGNVGAGGVGGTGSTPAPGACVVIHESATTIPQGWQTITRNPWLQRLSDGFAFEITPAKWRIGSEDGQWRDLDLQAATRPVFGAVAVGSVADPRVLWFYGTDQPGYDGTALVQTFGRDGAPLGDPVSLMPIFDRIASGVSTGSNQHGIAGFAHQYTPGNASKMVVVDKDGHHRGDVIPLVGSEDVYDCVSMTPTSDGLLAVAREKTTGDLLFFEVDTAGHLVHQSRWQPPVGLACGNQTVFSEPGTVLIQFTLRDLQNYDLSNEFYRYARTGPIAVASLPPFSNDRENYGWVRGGASPLFSIISGDQYTLARRQGDTFVPLQTLPGIGGVSRLGSSEGRLFFVNFDRPNASLKISEVQCGE